MSIKHLPEPKEFATNFERDNDLVKFVNGLIDVLKGYAEADVENSLDNGAKEQAKDDQRRVRNLIKIGELLQNSYR